jgi:hypothetical protein
VDLKQFDTRTTANKGVIFNPIPPGFTEPVKEVSFVIVGVDSKIFMDKAIKNAREDMDSMKRNPKKKEISDEDIEKAKKRRIEDIAVCILDWSGIEENGVKVDFSFANAVNLLTDYPWLFEQLDMFIGDRANFLPSAGQAGK